MRPEYAFGRSVIVTRLDSLADPCDNARTTKSIAGQVARSAGRRRTSVAVFSYELSSHVIDKHCGDYRGPTYNLLHPFALAIVVIGRAYDLKANQSQTKKARLKTLSPKLIKDQAFHHAFYWATFVLVGSNE